MFYIAIFAQLLINIILLIFLWRVLFDRHLLLLVVPFIGYESFKSIQMFRRRGIPTMLSITDGKLILLTPDRLRFRRVFDVDKDLVVRADRRGFTSTGLGTLHIERSGRKLATAFRLLSWPEIEWIANIINSALHPPDSV